MDQRILVLDDNPDILEIVEAVLLYEGYQVKGTDNKADFDQLLSNWNPNAVILDLKLSDGFGGDICRDIKQDEQTRHIPVILFSAYFNKEEDFAEFGCDGVITKPFDLEVLAAGVKRVLA